MTHHTDLELLECYARHRAEDAFAELVRRHVDLVYSAALRQVRSPQLAEEVAQSSFVDLARIASRLEPRTVVAAWLYEVTRRSAVDVIRRESRRQQREQLSIEMNALNNSGAEWAHVEPLLEEAMSALDAPDRAAVLLRFFERKNLREVGQALGVSEDAAQKRVARALERLRENLARRGVTSGAATLAGLLSLHAVQSAPAGLATTMAAIVGQLVAGAATAGAAVQSTQTIAMTLTQKSFVATGFIAVAGIAIYQAQLNRSLRSENAEVRRAHASATEQLEQLRQEQAKVARRLSQGGAAAPGNGRDEVELLRLRGEVARLKREGDEAAAQIEQASADLIDAWSKVPPVKTLIAVANETLARDQALVAGGWKTQDGKRALTIVTTEATDDGRTVTVRTKLVEYSEEAEQLMGIGRFRSSSGDSVVGTSQVISIDEANELMEAAKSTPGFTLVSSPTLTTGDGRQAQIKHVDVRKLPNGEDYELGPTVDLVPTVSPDGQRVQLRMTAKLNLPVPRPGRLDAPKPPGIE